MTRRVRSLSFALAIAAVGLCGCSDDSSGTPSGKEDGGGTTKDSGGTTKDTGSTSDTGGTTDDGGAEEAGPQTGACTNAGDAAGLVKKFNDKSLADIIKENALTCLAAGDSAAKKACLVTAMKTATNDEISEPCLGCFAGSAVCTADNGCTVVCLADPSAQACVDCRCGQNDNNVNCTAEFETCSGVPSDFPCS